MKALYLKKNERTLYISVKFEEFTFDRYIILKFYNLSMKLGC